MPSLISLYAIASCLSIAATNGILGLFLAKYLFNCFKEKRWDSPSIDFHLFSAIYGWKGITMIANGAVMQIYRTKEIWYKLPYWVVSKVKTSRNELIKMLHILFATNSLLVLYALSQTYLGLPSFVQPLFEEHKRMIGYFRSPMNYAGYISIVLILCFAMSKVDKRFLFYFFFLAIGLALSGTRGYYFASLFSCLLISFLKSKKSLYKSIAITPFVLFILASIFPEGLQRVSDTLNGNDSKVRLDLWAYAWNIFKDHPFLGVGYEQLSELMRPSVNNGSIGSLAHAHNLYLEEMAEGGVIGGLLITITMIYFVRKYYIYSRQMPDPSISAFSLGISISFLMLMIGGVTEYNFSTKSIWLFLTFLMGVLESYNPTLEDKQSQAFDNSA